MSIERERKKTMTTFIVANLVQDFFILIGNLAVAVQGFTGAVISTFTFIKFDQAMKYQDITGRDLGEAIGCPGHFTGECVHQGEHIGQPDDDDEM